MMAIREQDPALIGDRTMLAGFLGALFVVGPSFALLGLALPHAEDANDAGVIAVVAASYLGAALIFAFRRRLPKGSLELAAAYATVLISASIYFSGSTATPGAAYYLWVVLAAAYFLDRPRVAAQLVLIALGYGLALALKPAAPGMVQVWIVSLGTLSVAAAVLVATRERIASLVARLGEAADTDPLTGLLNRRGFGTQLELELERARRSGTPVSLVSGDLDNFKHVNDRFGHQAGDDVLVQVGGLLRGSARRSDALARLGGEEFALLIGGDAHSALVTAERLRGRVSAALGGRHPGLTISFGIASFPADGDSVDRLFRCADEALYAAKALGRDRSVVYSPQTAGALASRPQDRGADDPAAPVIPGS